MKNDIPEKLKFLQIHFFYENYLNEFYQKKPEILGGSFDQQIDALVKDGFSGIHMIAPYMKEVGYDSQLIIANDSNAQTKWLQENRVANIDVNNWIEDIVRVQIETIKPDILYLSEPLRLDSRFVRRLTYKPKLILGWRAANIPEDTDWSEFDVILSCLEGIRETALKLGAHAAEHFWPGFPDWMYEDIKDIQPANDIVFCGQWTLEQHPQRNKYLNDIASWSKIPGKEFNCAYYLSGQVDTLTPAVASCQLGKRFGVDMCRALRSGKIAFDARGDIGIIKTGLGQNPTIDLAQQQTANMRIFEATGCGTFLLTEYFDNLSEIFEPGLEIETFKNSNELEQKIHYYLKNSAEREEIALRGKLRCQKDHSMSVRVQKLHRLIKHHLSLKGISTSDMLENFNDNINSTQCVMNLSQKSAPGNDNMKQKEEGKITLMLDEALRNLKEGNVAQASAILIEAKKYRIPLTNLDYSRALCFLKMGKLGDAREALREELRHFPGNNDAKEMLKNVCEQEEKSIKHIPKFEDPEFRELLKIVRPYTMLPENRLANLFLLTKHVCENNIPGDFVECGVAGGGSTGLMSALIKRYSSSARSIYACDSFEGMPEPSVHDRIDGQGADDTGWGTGTCAAPEDGVKEICTRLETSEMLRIVKGYFENTLPRVKNDIQQIAMLHADCDWYESTLTIFENLYNKVVVGGIIQIDDYGYWEGVEKAVHEFEQKYGLSFKITRIEGAAWLVRQ